MKNLFILILFGILTINSKAQIINVNPDQDGDPWIVGNIPEYTQGYIEKLNLIPELELTDTSSQTPLPSVIDNSIEKYMPPIIDQLDASCSPAAGVGYNFTYEISRLRNLDLSNEDDSTNWYPTHFTYNFLNSGMGSNGSNIIDCWDIIKEQGCPTVPVYGGMAADTTHWMSGYDKYDTSLYNRLISYSKVTVTDSVKLDILKHWISDHNEGDSIGGLSNFCGYFGNPGYDIFPEESPEAGRFLVTHFGTGGGHSLTIVGYNDSVMYDFNGDSSFTKNIDINDDDTLDIRDWEIGAVRVANSWGVGYLDTGFVYVPYRLLAEREDTVGIKENHVYVLHLDTSQKYIKPGLVLKLKIAHPVRSKLDYHLGYSIKSGDTIPFELKPNIPFSCQYGGAFPMQGQNNFDPIEIELDFSFYFKKFFDTSNNHFGKIFLDVFEDTQSHAGDGTIHEFSLVDYRWDEVFELSYDDLPINITSQNDSILMCIEYDLIPFEMDYSPVGYYFSSNKICRRHCQANDSLEIIFGNGINVDFYKGTLVIEEDATLTIRDSVTIHAKTGADSLIVYGDIEIGDHVNFIADEGASFVIEIRNSDLKLDVNEAYFENVSFSAYNDSLAIDSCMFKHSEIGFYRTNEEYFVVSNSVFDTTYFTASVDENPLKDKGNVVVSDCKFTTDKGDAVINIDIYKNFQLLRDSIVFNIGDGINLSYSGSSVGQISQVKDCYVNYRGDPSVDTSRGINIYHSYTDVENNHVFNCTYGVACLNRSNVCLLGDEYAEDEDETQQIVNNHVNQVYALVGSFPYEFEYNAIYNDDTDDSLVYYKITYVPSGKFLDVRNNFWGEDGLDTVNGLIPSLKYYWDPVWVPSGHKSVQVDKQLFYDAKQAIQSGNYSEAEEKFKEIIEDHPESKYIQASVKELLVLKRIHDQDFEGLQNYLDSIPTLWEDEITANVTDHVINWCNIEKEDYVAAIIWFEDQIENPNSYADSICAIIDLGYTYTLMDTTSNKSSGFIGNYPQYRPASRAAYEKNREYLVDLLFSNKSHSNENEPKPSPVATFNLHQNYPNPVRETTTIKYTISEQSHVNLNVYNTLGSIITTLVNEMQREGEKQVSFNIQNLPNGSYYYSLEVDGEIIGVRKMVVLK